MKRWVVGLCVVAAVATGLWHEAANVRIWRQRRAAARLYYAGEIDAAIAGYAEVAARRPHDPRSHLDLADALLAAVEWREGRGDAAETLRPLIRRGVRHYLEAVRLAPPNAWAYQGLAALISTLGRARVRAEGLDLSTRMSTDLLGNLTAEERFEEAALVKAVQIEPANYYYRDFLGDYYLRHGFTDRAARQFRAAVKLQPSLGRHYFLSDLVVLSPQVLEAVEQGIHDALESPATEVRADEIQRMLADVYLRMGRTDKAREALEAAAAAAAEPYLLEIQIGRTLSSEGDDEAALAAFRRSAEQRPDYYRSWMFAGISLSRLGRHAEAVGALARARGLAPTEYQPAWLLAGELDRAGRSADAAELLETLIWTHPAERDPYLRLIELYRRENRLAESVQVARRLADRYPDESVYREQLEQLRAQQQGIR